MQPGFGVLCLAKKSWLGMVLKCLTCSHVNLKIDSLTRMKVVTVQMDILINPGNDPIYEKFRISKWDAHLGWNDNVKDYLQYLYRRNHVLLDKKFPSEISQEGKFYSCLWELCLAEWLQAQSKENSFTFLPHKDNGPDFSLRVEGLKDKLHIEAVCISQGSEPELNKNRIGTGVYQIPPDAMQARITNAFTAKHDQHIACIEDRDYYIVAIGLSGVPFANDTLGHGGCLGAFYPKGNLSVDFDPRTGQSVSEAYFSYREGFAKTGQNGEQRLLRNDYFLVDDFSHVSAVLIGREDVNFYLHSELIGQGKFSEMLQCQDLMLLHNSRARNPLPRGLLDVRFEVEYNPETGFRELNGKTGWI